MGWRQTCKRHASEQRRDDSELERRSSWLKAAICSVRGSSTAARVSGTLTQGARRQDGDTI